MKKRWLQLFNHNPKTMIEMYQTFIYFYTEPSRYYHTLNHIKTSLILFDEVKNQINDPFCIEIAIWFHDIIYNPQKNNNEVLSAQQARLFLQKIAIKSHKIEQLILLTQHPANPITEDEKYLIDIDLAILGSDPEIFEKYHQAIRKEYDFIPFELYQQKRKLVLKGFLNQNRLYQTDYFFNKFETQARENIKNQL